MTVKELMEILQKCDEGLSVEVAHESDSPMYDSYGIGDVIKIDLSKNEENNKVVIILDC